MNLLLGLLVACSVLGTRVDDEVVPAACGMCIYGLTTEHGCYWAIEYEGAYYAVNGHTPSNDEHDAHGPEGMCTTQRQARVSGTLRKGQLFADSFELLPFDPSAPQPDVAPHTHEH